MKLYHYVHCPFCVRIRMVTGFLQVKNVQSIVLDYDDEKTPIDLLGVKMLPIFDFSDGELSNESLDIIKRLDSENLLNSTHSIEAYPDIEPTLNKIGSSVHPLVMPYWIWTSEFNENSRNYFRKKKELKRGPFKKLYNNRLLFTKELNTILDCLKEKLTPFYKSKTITLNDILIASHLWGMYIVPEFQFSSAIHNYLQSIKELCSFEYHQDLWR